MTRFVLGLMAGAALLGCASLGLQWQNVSQSRDDLWGERVAWNRTGGYYAGAIDAYCAMQRLPALVCDKVAGAKTALITYDATWDKRLREARPPDGAEAQRILSELVKLGIGAGFALPGLGR